MESIPEHQPLDRRLWYGNPAPPSPPTPTHYLLYEEGRGPDARFGVSATVYAAVVCRTSALNTALSRGEAVESVALHCFVTSSPRQRWSVPSEISSKLFLRNVDGNAQASIALDWVSSTCRVRVGCHHSVNSVNK